MITTILNSLHFTRFLNSGISHEMVAANDWRPLQSCFFLGLCQDHVVAYDQSNVLHTPVLKTRRLCCRNAQ
jgi:hypothetical protein